jgi:hypothetical protein
VTIDASDPERLGLGAWQRLRANAARRVAIAAERLRLALIRALKVGVGERPVVP